MTDEFAPSAELSAAVATVVRKHLQDWSRDDIPLASPLSELGLDSMSAVNLVLDLESAFSILFPDEVLTPERFETLERVTDLVHELTSNR